MSFRSRIIRIAQKIESIIRNPTIYVGAVVGVIVGGGAGVVIGLIAGGFIGYDFKICSACTTYLTEQLQIDPSIALGSSIGAVMGAALGGIIIAAITVFKVYKKNSKSPLLSHDNINETLLDAFWISIEVAIGMSIGAVIGSLKHPGIGSILGAMGGIILMLFTATLEKKPKRTLK